MSFYQPSLSLYDVLNALSDQGQARNSRSSFYNLPRRQATAEAQRRAERASAARRSPIFGRFDGSPAAYYGIPSEQYYYRPDYYDYSDDEQEYGAGEEEEQDQNADFGNPYLGVPSYYHVRPPRGYEGSSLSEHADPIQELLNALVGARRGEEQPGQPEKETRKVTGPVEHEDEQGETAKGIDVPETSNLETEAHPTSRKKPALARSTSSNPLKVSKPETRLDVPFSPEVNVYDCPDAYIAVVALPGATSKEFKIDYHPSSHELIIKGTIEDKLNLEEKYLKVTELKYGAFHRTVRFPVLPRIKDEEIKATYSNGLLQVRVPKLNDGSDKPAPKKRIVIEEVPDEELKFEENPNPVEQ